MVDIWKHPLLKQAVEVCYAIEECGASDKLTDAVVKASALAEAIDRELDRIANALSEISAELKTKPRPLNAELSGSDQDPDVK